jgi:Holliday junction resolvasome RuvABC DNA-binding subunit
MCARTCCGSTGFQSALEREWFRLLMSNVQGVGAKVALAILSTLAPADLANADCIAGHSHGQQSARRRQEVAERIVTELKNKAPAYAGTASGTIGLKQGSERAWRRRRSQTPSRRWSISAIRVTPPPMRWRRR